MAAELQPARIAAAGLLLTVGQSEHLSSGKAIGKEEKDAFQQSGL